MPSPIAERVVAVAQAKVGREDWAFYMARGGFARNSNKCNQFVYDVLVEAGVDPRPLVSARSIPLPLGLGLMLSSSE